MSFFAIIIAILILLIMITVHEFGHYVAGKIFKFKINEFAIGMGPAIFKRTRKNGEIFSIRAFPLGGYCAFEGEDENNDNPNAFNNKKPWQRIIVLIAGALMNFLLALLVIVVMFSCYGKSVYKVEEINTSGYTYSLQSGDKILEVDGKKIFLATDIVERLDGKDQGDMVEFTVLRDGNKKSVSVEIRNDINAKSITDMSAVCYALGVNTFARMETENEYSPFKNGDYLLYLAEQDLGEITSQQLTDCKRITSHKELIDGLKAYSSSQKAYFYALKVEDNSIEKIVVTIPSNWEQLQNLENDEILLQGFGVSMKFYFRLGTSTYKEAFFQRFGESFIYAFKIGGTIFETLGQLLTGKLGLDSVGGPVTTITTTSKIVSQGFKYLLEIMAFIGVNLAVFNLLPIPALDGSRVVFTLIEWIFRKPVPKKIEGLIHAVGLIVLLGFSVLVDVLQLM
jgi:regulator of sigma E protease